MRPLPSHTEISQKTTGGTTESCRNILKTTGGHYRVMPKYPQKTTGGHYQNIPINSGDHEWVTPKYPKIQKTTTGSLRNIPINSEDHEWATLKISQKCRRPQPGHSKISQKLQEATTRSLQNIPINSRRPYLVHSKYPNKFKRPRMGHSEIFQKKNAGGHSEISQNIKYTTPKICQLRFQPTKKYHNLNSQPLLLKTPTNPKPTTNP